MHDTIDSLLQAINLTLKTTQPNAIKVFLHLVIYSGKQKSKTYFFRFFKNNFVKIELYLSSSISLKKAQKIISNLTLIDFF